MFKLPKMDDLENSDLLRSSIPNMFHWASIDPYHLNLISSPWSWPVQLKVHDLVDLALCQGEAPRWNRLIYHGLIFVCQANHDQKPQINQLIPIIHIIYMCVCAVIHSLFMGRIWENKGKWWPTLTHHAISWYQIANKPKFEASNVWLRSQLTFHGSPRRVKSGITGHVSCNNDFGESAAQKFIEVSAVYSKPHINLWSLCLTELAVQTRQLATSFGTDSLGAVVLHTGSSRVSLADSQLLPKDKYTSTTCFKKASPPVSISTKV